MQPPVQRFARLAGLVLLVVTTGAALYTAAQNARAARELATQALDGVALSLASAAEAARRRGVEAGGDELRAILADRVVAYALIAGADGTIRFHTNERLVGGPLAEPDLGAWLRAGTPYGRRIQLGTGLPGYEFNAVLHPPTGPPELLRLVLHTVATDRIVERARRIWGVVGAVVAALWAAAFLLDRALVRAVRLEREAAQRAQLALIGQMTATLAHEIRNALGGIKGYTQWAAEKLPSGDPVRQGLDLALRGTARIESVLRDLLLYAREESYDVRPVGLVPLVREALAVAATSWAGTVELTGGDDAHVLADPEKVRRVLVNGLRNAVEAMGEAGTLEVAVAVGPRAVTLRIADSGPGVPAAERPRLFTPFHTTKTDGTGLGLAYSKKVTEAMGGRITLDDRPGGGAVLTVELPAAPAG